VVVWLGRLAECDPGAGPGQPQEVFPTVATVPGPQLGWDQRREPLMSGTAEGGRSGGRDPSEGGGIQARRAGFDEQEGFPTVAPPPEWRRRCAHNDGLASMQSKGWTQGNGIRG